VTGRDGQPIQACVDLAHPERMQLVTNPGRRPAAILMADLEGSSQLSRRLSTASYFSLGRGLVRAADKCVVDTGGIVGRHVGDGVVAFFLAVSAGSESAAVRACISASRELRAMVGAVASRGELQPEDVISSRAPDLKNPSDWDRQSTLHWLRRVSRSTTCGGGVDAFDISSERLGAGV